MYINSDRAEYEFYFLRKLFILQIYNIKIAEFKILKRIF